MNQLLDASTTGNIGPAIGSTVVSATITAAGATAVLVLREGGASGTVRLTISAAATTSFQWIGSVGFSGQIHATTTGAGATAYVEL